MDIVNNFVNFDNASINNDVVPKKRRQYIFLKINNIQKVKKIFQKLTEY